MAPPTSAGGFPLSTQSGPPDELDVYVPLPSSSSLPAFRSTSSLTPLVCDERAISRLLTTLLSRADMTVSEAARRMGVTPNTVRQYLRGRRNKPSLLWFVKLAELCGAKVTIEFPPKGVR